MADQQSPIAALETEAKSVRRASDGTTKTKTKDKDSSEKKSRTIKHVHSKEEKVGNEIIANLNLKQKTLAGMIAEDPDNQALKKRKADCDLELLDELDKQNAELRRKKD